MKQALQPASGAEALRLPLAADLKPDARDGDGSGPLRLVRVEKHTFAEVMRLLSSP